MVTAYVKKCPSCGYTGLMKTKCKNCGKNISKVKDSTSDPEESEQ